MEPLAIAACRFNDKLNGIARGRREKAPDGPQGTLIYWATELYLSSGLSAAAVIPSACLELCRPPPTRPDRQTYFSSVLARDLYRLSPLVGLNLTLFCFDAVTNCLMKFMTDRGAVREV